jgi:2-desacetyl-2-hydroxyethyl bacteriochlorophyllide A dehydrogenase
MRALRLLAPGDLRLLELPRPVPGPGQVVCRVDRVGVCGTDHAIFSGEASFVKSGAVRFPFTPGHEWSGVVAERGPGADRFAVGDRVVGDTGVACGSCTECLLGRWPRCRHARAVGTVAAWDGAFAEHILMPERHLYALPDTVSLDNGALVEPAATALLAVQKAGVGIGDTVLVQGSGPIGLLAAKLARLSGAARVFVTGRRDRTLAAALSFGADEAIDTRRESASAALRRLVPSGKVDRLVEATGSSAVFAESLGLVEPGGALSVVAFYDRPLDRFDIDAFVFAEVALVPVAGSLGAYPPVLDLMAGGRLDASALVTERLRLEGVPDLLARFRDDPGRLKAMVEV